MHPASSQSTAGATWREQVTRDGREHRGASVLVLPRTQGRNSNANGNMKTLVCSSNKLHCQFLSHSHLLIFSDNMWKAGETVLLQCQNLLTCSHICEMGLKRPSRRKEKRLLLVLGLHIQHLLPTASYSNY